MPGPTPLRAAVVLTLLVTLAALAGCGTASEPSPPAGVDQLVVPTPSPDPDDFVETVDNPWLPLAQGSAVPHGDRTATVGPGPTVAGVATTAVTVRASGGEVVDWYAQDEAGNVWWFGREGEWEAGVAGAQAGLAMAAVPRVGDGYRTAYAEGVVEDRVRVVSLADDVLVTELRSDLDPGAATTLTYERGTGLVESDRTCC